MSERSFVAQVERFVDPSEQIDAPDQLEVIYEFWTKVGVPLPPLLNSPRMHALQLAAEAHSDKRIVPAPLLGVQGRAKMVESLGNIAGGEGAVDRLWTPLEEPGEEGRQRLIRKPEKDTRAGSRSIGMRYKTPDFRYANRKEYMQALLESGKAVGDAKRGVWTYPVMEVRLDLDHGAGVGADMIRRVEPTLTVESLIALRLIHRLAGAQSESLTIDAANEGMFWLERGDPRGLDSIAGVSLTIDGSTQVNLGYYQRRGGSLQATTGFGLREAVSGL